MFLSADLVVKTVMVGLALASVVTADAAAEVFRLVSRDCDRQRPGFAKAAE